jgi:hypothetical protein
MITKQAHGVAVVQKKKEVFIVGEQGREPYGE